MKEKFEIFKQHFKAGFLKASAFFAVWFIIYRPVVFLIRLLARALHSQLAGVLVHIPLFLIFYAAFYYALWVGIVLIFDGKFNKTDFLKTAARQWWFIAVIFIIQALTSYSGFIFNHMMQNNIMSFQSFFKILQYFNLAVGAVSVFFTCMFLITARLGVSLAAGVKDKLEENWPVIVVFVVVSLIGAFILFGVFSLYGTQAYRLASWAQSVILFLISFVSQFVQYVLIPFIALSFIVEPGAVSPSEKMN